MPSMSNSAERPGPLGPDHSNSPRILTSLSEYLGLRASIIALSLLGGATNSVRADEPREAARAKLDAKESILLRPAILRFLNGAETTGVIEGFTPERIVLKYSHHSVEYPLSDIVSVNLTEGRPPERGLSSPRIILRDGSEIIGQIGASDAGFRAVDFIPSIGAALKAPSTQTRAVQLQEIPEPLLESWRLAVKEKEGDVLCVFTKDRKDLEFVEGAIHRIEPEHIVFNLNDEELKVPRKKIAGMILLRPLKDTDNHEIEIFLRDSSRISTSALDLKDGTLTCSVADNLILTRPSSELLQINLSKGKEVSLASLTPNVISFGSPAAQGERGFEEWLRSSRPTRPVSTLQHTDALNYQPAGLAIEADSVVQFRIPSGMQCLVGEMMPAQENPADVRLVISTEAGVLIDKVVAPNTGPIPLRVSLPRTSRISIEVKSTTEGIVALNFPSLKFTKNSSAVDPAIRSQILEEFRRQAGSYSEPIPTAERMAALIEIASRYRQALEVSPNCSLQELSDVTTSYITQFNILRLGRDVETSGGYEFIMNECLPGYDLLIRKVKSLPLDESMEASRIDLLGRIRGDLIWSRNHQNEDISREAGRLIGEHFFETATSDLGSLCYGMSSVNCDPLVKAALQGRGQKLEAHLKKLLNEYATKDHGISLEPHSEILKALTALEALSKKFAASTPDGANEATTWFNSAIEERFERALVMLTRRTHRNILSRHMSGAGDEQLLDHYKTLPSFLDRWPQRKEHLASEMMDDLLNQLVSAKDDKRCSGLIRAASNLAISPVLEQRFLSSVSTVLRQNPSDELLRSSIVPIISKAIVQGMIRPTDSNGIGVDSNQYYLDQRLAFAALTRAIETNQNSTSVPMSRFLELLREIGSDACYGLSATDSLSMENSSQLSREKSMLVFIEVLGSLNRVLNDSSLEGLNDDGKTLELRTAYDPFTLTVSKEERDNILRVVEEIDRYVAASTRALLSFSGDGWTTDNMVDVTVAALRLSEEKYDRAHQAEAYIPQRRAEIRQALAPFRREDGDGPFVEAFNGTYHYLYAGKFGRPPNANEEPNKELLSLASRYTEALEGQFSSALALKLWAMPMELRPISFHREMGDREMRLEVLEILRDIGFESRGVDLRLLPDGPPQETRMKFEEAYSKATTEKAQILETIRASVRK